MAEAEDSDDDIPLFPSLPDPDDEPRFPGPTTQSCSSRPTSGGDDGSTHHRQ